MSKNPKHLVIIAGEASGDQHAAELVKELKKSDASLTISGLGGQKMREAGVEIYTDLTRLALIGFFEVARHYFAIRKIFYFILNKIEELRPDAVILVDYPGFNLRLAKALKKKGIKVIYYISPQVWAWKESRVKALRETTDKILVLFEFEKEFYEKRGASVECVGHPLVDSILGQVSDGEPPEQQSLSDDRLTIGLIPGSRKKEIQSILPVMLKAAALVAQEKKGVQFLLVRAPTIDKNLILQYLPGEGLPVTLSDDSLNKAVKVCDLCMVTSGTATLEVALMLKPMVVIYKTSLLTWLLAKCLIKIPFIGLVNIVAGKEVVPECIQFEATADRIASELKALYQGREKYCLTVGELRKVRAALGRPGASQRAARSILNML